jgi:5-hydroxyisourate hydrolase
MARISTHVLDIELGRPAAGVPVELRRDGALLSSASTNTDGRTDRPLLSAEQIDPGRYELIFRTSEYLRTRGASPFYDDIAIRFAVSDASGNYHIPLLLAAQGYSTYRGS